MEQKQFTVGFAKLFQRAAYLESEQYDVFFTPPDIFLTLSNEIKATFSVCAATKSA